MINKSSIFLNPKKEIAIAFQKNTINKQSFLSDTIKFETILQEKHFLNKLAHIFDNLTIVQNTTDNRSKEVEAPIVSTVNTPASLSKKRFCIPRYYSDAKPSTLKPLKEGRFPVKVPRTLSEEVANQIVDDNQQCLTREFLDGLVKVLQQCLNKVQNLRQNMQTTFQELLKTAQALQEKKLGYTIQDMITTRNLSWETVNTIGRSDLDESQKVSLMAELSEIYENVSLLQESYSRSRVRELLNLLFEIKDVLTPEDYVAFLDLQEEIFNLDNQVEEYTNEDIENIVVYTLLLSEKINQSSLSRADKIDYNRQLMVVYNEQVESLETYQKVVDTCLAAREHQLEIFKQVMNQVAAFFGLFAPINLTNSISDFTASGASAALQALFAIDSMFEYLNDGQKKLVNDAFKTSFDLSFINTSPRASLIKSASSGVSFGDSNLEDSDFVSCIAIVWAYFLASQTLAKDPIITLTKVNEAVRTGVKDFKDSKFDMMKEVATKVEQIGKDGSQRAASSSTGNGQITVNGVVLRAYFQGKDPEDKEEETFRASLAAADDSRVHINYRLMNTGGTLFLNWGILFQEAKNYISQNYFRFRGLCNTINLEAETELGLSRNNLKWLSDLEQNVYMSSLVAKTGELQALALPSAVATVLIDHYMPREVDFLNDSYAQLYYSNFGSTVGNAVLEVVAPFVNSATYFNFASYVGKQPAVGMTLDDDAYPGSLETAERKLSDERLQATLFLQQAEAGLAEIDKQMAIVDGDEKITLSQRTTLMDMLTNYKTSLLGIINNLVTVSNFLSQITVSAVTEQENLKGLFVAKGPGKDWQNSLENLEDALVSGFSNQSIPNGMFPLHALVQSDQQSFADMGQNHQLNLQMHLTGMQQEWTVISTSLQILNQVYLGLVRSLLG